jgi:hypothetical protein
MFPDFAPRNHRDSATVYVKFICDGFVSHIRCPQKSENFYYLRLSKFGVSIFLANGPILRVLNVTLDMGGRSYFTRCPPEPALRNRIECVHALRGLEEMVSTYARRIITVMSNAHPAWVLTVLNVESNPTGRIDFGLAVSLYTYTSVSASSTASFPFPASSGIGFVHSLPEALNLFRRKIRDWFILLAGHVACTSSDLVSAMQLAGCMATSSIHRLPQQEARI